MDSAPELREPLQDHWPKFLCEVRGDDEGQSGYGGELMTVIDCANYVVDFHLLRLTYHWA
ncbi:hypothetical protein AGABI2DRAFT_195882 [Agaricus bisporus var. bisporus H97]|uniref:hypothetical protein n=1 Tax=Agaricus bisporus var. bisporus (strain H97 / ATCC MYA-4626 / FGSC 10389) TaxID=936046 RepID=UPI00029F7729|nr:hypothetical protein AGABI2DRAFT_195882 [Agaricus bisporus var. bisporus H97]EKV42597.1 hypothetical protein AGABI2DRAFT_195882 [Agaricus bisporus var. bisporus H97]